MKLMNKVAIVTGAASGIGASIAKLYAKEGAKVVVSDMNLSGAEQVVQEIKSIGGEAIAVATNVVKNEDIDLLFQTTLDTYQRLDILVNNAGVMDGIQPVGEVEDERWDAIMAINMTSVMKTMRKAVQLFLEQGSGVIVNDISVGGLAGARAGAAYTASKHAVIGLTKNTAYMYAKDNIRCNGLAPGSIETNITSSMKQVSEFGGGRQALGMETAPRFGKPEEVAKVALFLASDDADFVNGEIVVVDGGWLAY